MVEQQTRRLDRVFGALSDPTRRAIVARLSRRPATVGEIAAPFAISLAAVSKHVQVLERAGIVHRDIRGRTHHCSLERDALRSAADWVERYHRFWDARLDALEQVLEARRAPKRR
ncbi:MAG: metalloregulator ArsR/SmtB family transcription factor [Gemmatimonadota bacterium]|nr:metalloregulator ArsR/SmtB family transcription factor [Gemmatimonadota bacterium]